ncbi:MAG: triose-phosphate isomerase [Phycisphaerales bacterium]|nr:triose-phosphate isomerase [Phycisphaerales bacterium]
MRTPFVAGNWKMHNDLAAARDLMKGLRAEVAKPTGVDVAVCTPFTLLYPMGKELDGTDIKLGAQNCYFEPKGAFTGEISADMLKAAGCTYVIIGHSERRHVFGETGEMLKKKVVAAQQAGLHVIYCIGELLEERERGKTETVVDQQMKEVLTPDLDTSLLTIAYEPVWAIGTGKTATPDQAQAVHAFVRAKLSGIYGSDVANSLRIQYGGSVKPGNAAELFSCPDVDGGLVGGACLVAGDFAAIIRAAQQSAGK